MQRLVLILILNCWCSYAQILPVLSTTSLANPADDLEIGKNGNYAMDTNNDRNQYVGLWEYNQNGILFQIKIEKIDQAINRIDYNGETYYSYCDKVILKYKLVKNGTTLNDNLNQSNATIDILTSGGFYQASAGYLRGHMLDYTRNVVAAFTINKINSNPEKIIFNLNSHDYTRLNPDSFYQPGVKLFSLPLGDIEMVKVN